MQINERLLQTSWFGVSVAIGGAAPQYGLFQLGTRKTAAFGFRFLVLRASSFGVCLRETKRKTNHFGVPIQSRDPLSHLPRFPWPPSRPRWPKVGSSTTWPGATLDKYSGIFLEGLPFWGGFGAPKGNNP